MNIIELKSLQSLEGLRVEILDPVPLEKLDPRKANESRGLFDHMKVNGVYFLQEALDLENSFSPFGENIIYIGKASGRTETIFQRCRKHCSSLLNLKTNDGRPRERPGQGLKNIRDRRSSTADGILAFPALIICNERIVTLDYQPYLISLTEEFLLYEYRQHNGGKLPEGNVKN